MTRENYEALVARMEELAARDPAGYEAKCKRFATLGTAVYSAMFGLAALLFVGAVLLVVWNPSYVTVKLGLIVGFVTLAFLRGFFIKVDPPEFQAVTKEDSPELLADVEEIRAKLGAPEIEAVMVDDTVNAFAAAVPGRTMFSKKQYYVVVGLPLMRLLERDELRAVLAHELAHHGKAHTTFSLRAHEVDMKWQYMAASLAESALARATIGKFAIWFAPQFSAMTTVLQRKAEFEADAGAAQAVSPRAAATGLIRINMSGNLIWDSHMRDLWKRVRDQDKPPGDAVTQFIQSPPSPSGSHIETLVRALKRTTMVDDSHPALRERIIALGQGGLIETDERVASTASELAPAPERSAVHEYFGERSEQFAKAADLILQGDWSESWTEGHKAVLQARASLAALAETPEEELDQERLYEKARNLAAVGESEASKDLLRRSLDRFPSDVKLRRALGQQLLKEDDSEGVEHLELAQAHGAKGEDLVYIQDALARYFNQRGESYAAREAAIRSDELEEKYYEVQEDLYSPDRGDDLQPIALDDAKRARLQELLSPSKRFKSAYAITKRSKLDPDAKADLLVIFCTRPFLEGSDDKELQNAYEGVWRPIEQDVGLRAITGYDNIKFAKWLPKKMESALAYDRKQLKRKR